MSLPPLPTRPPGATTSERWLAIPGWEGIYEVSDAGRVRSLDRVVTNGRRTKGKVLVQNPHPADGRYSVGLYRGGSGTRRMVHQLVLEAFVGPRPSSRHHACHRDDVCTNNALTNLYWGTPEQNAADLVRNGRHPLASRTHCNYGHEFTEENTAWVGTRRRCRECDRLRCRIRRARAKAAAS